MLRSLLFMRTANVLRTHPGLCPNVGQERPERCFHQRFVGRRLHADRRRAHETDRGLDRRGSRGFQSDCPRGQLLRKIKPHAGQTRKQVRCMGNRSHGASLPENRTHRGTGKILRGNCSRNSRPAFLLLPHPGLQRSLPANKT